MLPSLVEEHHVHGRCALFGGDEVLRAYLEGHVDLRARHGGQPGRPPAHAAGGDLLGFETLHHQPAIAVGVLGPVAGVVDVHLRVGIGVVRADVEARAVVLALVVPGGAVRLPLKLEVALGEPAGQRLRAIVAVDDPPEEARLPSAGVLRGGRPAAVDLRVGQHRAGQVRIGPPRDSEGHGRAAHRLGSEVVVLGVAELHLAVQVEAELLLHLRQRLVDARVPDERHPVVGQHPRTVVVHKCPRPPSG